MIYRVGPTPAFELSGVKVGTVVGRRTTVEE